MNICRIFLISLTLLSGRLAVANSDTDPNALNQIRLSPCAATLLVRQADLINRGHIGFGSYSNGYRVAYKDQLALVYVQRKALTPSPKWSAAFVSILPLTENEKKALNSIDVAIARKLITAKEAFDFHLIGLPNMSELLTDYEADRLPVVYMLAFFTAEMIENANYQMSFDGLVYNGHSMAPKFYGYVVGAEGIRNGVLMESIPGQDLYQSVARGLLAASDIDAIVAQAKAQLEFLHSQGRVHGDPTARNIIYQKNAEGRFSVRWIDFSSPLMYADSPNNQRGTPAQDIAEFNFRIEEARQLRDNHEPPNPGPK